MKTFIDLFAGIGGTRTAFENIGAECVFSSEWDRFAQQTYVANFGETPHGDIREIKASDIPDHDVLLAGFPCQPFSIAGVSKKNSLGHAHGFDDDKQGNLFFDITRILEAKQPKAFMLENVRNLKTHDRGRTFKIIHESLQQLDYNVSYQVLDAQGFVPQHRERIYIVGFHRDAWPDLSFTFPKLPVHGPRIGDILEDQVDDKYTLSDHLWDYLQSYAEKHRRRGNGFGFGLVDPARDRITRTLSARYYKDGSEILIKQRDRNPRRLTPRECARLMGFSDEFEIPVSDTQAYRQFGNSVVVPLVEELARTMLGWQMSVKAITEFTAGYAQQFGSVLAKIDNIALHLEQSNATIQSVLDASKSVANAEREKSLNEAVKNLALHLEQSNATIQAALDSLLSIDHSSHGSLNRKIDQLHLVTGNLAEMLKYTPQPFTAFELSSFLAQTADQIDSNLERPSLSAGGQNGVAIKVDELAKKTRFTFEDQVKSVREAVTSE